jgi:hypothetical protein
MGLRNLFFYRMARPLPLYPMHPCVAAPNAENPSPHKNRYFVCQYSLLTSLMSYASPYVLCFALCLMPNVVCIIVSDNHPLVFAGVDSLLEFEFWEGSGKGVAFVYEGYFVCGLDG